MALVFGYFCGSIPFGLVLTRFAGTADLRSIGSGNIGATNVLRTGRKDLAAATLLARCAEGSRGRADRRGARARPAAALRRGGAFLGHVFPVWLGFRGGKGVATFLGCLFGLDWHVALVFVIVWLAVARDDALFLGRRAGRERGDTARAGYRWASRRRRPLWPSDRAALGLHRANIARLLAGTESKIGGAKTAGEKA